MDTEIKTERLILRLFTLTDAPRVHELLGEWDVARMMLLIPHPYPKGAAEQWIVTHAPRREAGKAYIFAITQNGEVAGAIGIHAQSDGTFSLGYWLGVPYWGRGIMSEAVAAVVAFAFTTLGLPRLVAGHFVDNRASERVLQKAGFSAVGRETKHCVARAADMEHVLVALNRDTWSAKSGINTP